MRALAAVLVLLLVAAGAVALIGGRLPTDGRPTPEPPPTRRPQASPTGSPLETAVVSAAIVVPRRSADVSAPITARVVEVAVQEQEQVFTGELLVRLDPATRQAAGDLAQADVARAEAAVDRAQIQVDQLPDDASPAQRESAAAELRLAEAEIALAQTELRAPFAGTVAWIGVAVGEQAVADQPVVSIGDLSEWFIQTTDLSELDVVRVAVGDRAEITFEALPGVTVGGTVDRIQVRGDAEQGGVRFDVFVRPDIHRPELRWNMSARVRILPGG